MWKCWILVLCATGISAAIVEPQNFSITNQLSRQRARPGRQNETIRRFACPIGFFRLKRYCYYLSAGMAPWRDAHFHCKDRNATLAVLDRNGKDKVLRKYLMGDQFTKLERWIGGIFNWQRMAWEWGVTGEKMDFESFGDAKVERSEQFAWHCTVMDPAMKYKWSARGCVDRKYYICEVPAGRVARRRRKKTVDSFAPQNQRLKPRKKGKKYREEGGKSNRRNKVQPSWTHDYAEQNANQQWVHGVKLGSRPPTNVKSKNGRSRIRHHSNRTQPVLAEPQVAQILPKGRQYGAFQGGGHLRPHNHPQSLSNAHVYSEFAKMDDLAREEILLKP